MRTFKQMLLEDMKPKTLYVSRPLATACAEEFIAWAKSVGFEKTLLPSDLHVTIAFSRRPVDWSKIKPDNSTLIVPEGKRVIKPLGDQGAVVMMFESTSLHARWAHLLKLGCSWEYAEYKPHISITYDGGEKPPLNAPPFKGRIVLSEEKFAEVDLDWNKKITEA